LEADQAFTNGKTQARATVLTVGLNIGVFKAIEDLFLAVRCNANACVLHLKQDACTNRLCADLDMPCRGELERVIKQVVEHLYQALTVSPDPHAVHRAHI
jgi:hypothetical protein